MAAPQPPTSTGRALGFREGLVILGALWARRALRFRERLRESGKGIARLARWFPLLLMVLSAVVAAALLGPVGTGGSPASEPFWRWGAAALLIQSLAMAPFVAPALPPAGISFLLAAPVPPRAVVAFLAIRGLLGGLLLIPMLWAVELTLRPPTVGRLLSLALGGLALASTVQATLVAFHAVACRTGYARIAAVTGRGRGSARISSALALLLLAIGMASVMAAVMAWMDSVLAGRFGTPTREPAIGPLLGACRVVAEALGSVIPGARTLGRALSAEAPGLAHGAAWTLAALTNGTAVLVAPWLSTERMITQSVRVASRKYWPIGGQPSRARSLRAFGTGATALIWKSLSEARRRPWRRGRIALTLLFACFGVASGLLLGSLGRLGSGSVPVAVDAALLLMLATVGLEFGLMKGGLGGLGLGSEIVHVSWLLRYPVQPAQSLGVLLGTSCASSLVPILLVMLPTLVLGGTARAPAACLLASSVSLVLSFRLAQAVLWLRWPSVARTAREAMVIPTLGAWVLLAGADVGAGIALRASGAPLELAFALAGLPSAAAIGIFWPVALRLFRRLEAA
ncbi:MAG: hypothetical protein L0216_19965 [Planctomycetales bacterium]|nr:hypothetical protein [Planctomycetales bacterium]